MTTQQIELVQQSWAKVKPMAQLAGELFYSNLFEEAPQVRGMFRTDIKAQSGKLTYMLDFIVNRLTHLNTIQQDIVKLAARHNTYKAEPAHYALVGKCLLKTLQQGLGEYWNEELQHAWVAAYSTLSDAMIKAQKQMLHTAA